MLQESQYESMTDIVSSDHLVGLATVGQTSFNGVTYRASSEIIMGILPVGATGVNHGDFSSLPDLIENFTLLCIRHRVGWSCFPSDDHHSVTYRRL
jgi:hypothetical protein